MAQQTFTGRKRVRKFFGHIKEVAEMPNLIEVQKASYDQFLMVDEPPGGRLDEGGTARQRVVPPRKNRLALDTRSRRSCWLNFLTFAAAAGALADSGKLAAVLVQLPYSFKRGEDERRYLGALCDQVGHRLSGSPQLDKAIAWAMELMKAEGFSNVRAEPVQFPHWVRNAERADLILPRPQSLTMLGLGTAPLYPTSSMQVTGDISV